MKVQTVPIDSLHFDPANVRKHPDRNLDTIKASLARFGQQTPIVVDEKNIVRKGNGTLAAAKALGWDKIDVVKTGLAGVDATAYSIADNRSGDLAEYDDRALAETLRALQEEGFDVEAIGFTDDEIAALLPEFNEEVDEGPEAQSDRAGELQEKWKTEPGQLWLIPSKTSDGREHRLLCGDSTSKDDVAIAIGKSTPFIMVTDPPYGVEYDPTHRDDVGGKFGDGKTKMRGKVQNDDVSDWTEAYNLFPGSVAYVWHASFFTPEVGMNLKSADFLIRASIIWRKPHFVLSQGHYHWQHEPCWYVVKKEHTAKWCGDRTQSTIWDIKSMGSAGGSHEVKTVHGTQKPIECMARPIRNHGEKSDDVYDPFLGSGTTILAAEQLGRVCFGLEICPKYVAVILERLSDFGLQPYLSS